jgi:hypothetical protein
VTTSSPQKKLPLVFARAAALDQARELVPGIVLENAIRGEILEGRLGWMRRNETALVALTGDVVATVKRSRTPSGRRCWLATAVRSQGSDRREAA